MCGVRVVCVCVCVCVRLVCCNSFYYSYLSLLHRRCCDVASSFWRPGRVITIAVPKTIKEI